MLDQLQSCYRVTAYEARGHLTHSLSNEACIAPDPRIYQPNAFTPNGDGINDRFLVKGSFVSGFYLAIYDRWGVRVYQSDDIDEGWDGTNPTGQPLPTGVYTFSLRGVGYSGKLIEMGGTVQLVR